MARNIQITLRNGETISLTEKEQLFVNYYLGDANRNATQAAIKTGYSPKTAMEQASRLLSNVKVAKYLHDQTAPILEALGATKDAILKEWAELAFSRPGMEITKDTPVPIGYQDSHNFKTLTIEGVEVDSHEKSVTFNYSPKVKALTVISEHLGIIDRTPKQAAAPVQITNLFQQINNYIEGK